MSYTQDTQDHQGGQATHPHGARRSRFLRVVQPSLPPVSANSAPPLADSGKTSKKSTKKRQSSAPRGTQRKKLNPVAVWCDAALAGDFGEFAAEGFDNSTLVRRWNGHFWELMGENDGYARATSWLHQEFPGQLSSGRAADCWRSLTGLLHSKRPLKQVDVGHIVFPMLDGYLHIDAGRCWVEAPDKALGLIHQIKARTNTAVGIDYVPAEVPADSLFGRFLSSSLPEADLRLVVQEQCALSFLPNRYQQVAWWIGDGGAGKGTLTKMLLRFHSKAATVDLHKLNEPHHLEALVDASAVVVDEVAQNGRWAEKEFKSIVSGDVFTVNPKHRAVFKCQCFAYWIICSNQEPMIRDDSDGVRRRIVPVPWPGSARTRGVSLPDLDRLIFEREGHLFLGWIVEGLLRVLRRGGPMPMSQMPAKIRALSNQMRKDNDSVDAWFDACEIVPSADVEYSKTQVYEAYCKYADDAHAFVYERESFWKRFWRRTDIRNSGVREVRGRTGNERTQMIRGLAITPAEVAKAKRAAIYANAQADGRFTVTWLPGLTPESQPFESNRYQLTIAEEQELDRLAALSMLRA